jgi:hypothetical protein
MGISLPRGGRPHYPASPTASLGTAGYRARTRRAHAERMTYQTLILVRSMVVLAAVIAAAIVAAFR